MRRYSKLSFVFALLLVFACASASFAIFPGTKYGLVGPNTAGDGNTTIQLYQGWVDGTVAWYSCFATNNIRVAQTQNLTLTPLLTIATANWMYVVTNYNQGPAFTYAPPGPPYTGIWAVQYITWRPGVTPWVITNPSLGVTGAAPGLPNGTQAYYSMTPIPPQPLPGPQPLVFSGLPFAAFGFTILDCPIFAVGQISNPWVKIAPGIYRIPQGRTINTYTKQLTIPFWYVYCRNDITRAISVERIIIPDVGDPALAALIGANYAPLLNNAPPDERNSLYVFNWRQDISMLPGIQPLKVLANQYPVRSECPRPCGPRNQNYDYTPLATFTLINRVNLNLAEVLFNNEEFILQQIMAGNLAFTPPRAVFNAPVLCNGINGTPAR